VTTSNARQPGRRGPATRPRHVQQFQLAVLELERTRKLEERRVALRRIAELNARLGELELLMGALQHALAVPVPPRLAAAGGAS